MARASKSATILKLISDQQKWIEEHGGCLSAYIERYGRPGEENCYGNGGKAIYEADVGELKRLEAKA